MDESERNRFKRGVELAVFKAGAPVLCRLGENSGNSGGLAIQARGGTITVLVSSLDTTGLSGRLFVRKAEAQMEAERSMDC